MITSCNSTFEQGNLDLWRYINAFIINIITAVLSSHVTEVTPNIDHSHSTCSCGLVSPIHVTLCQRRCDFWRLLEPTKSTTKSTLSSAMDWSVVDPTMNCYIVSFSLKLGLKIKYQSYVVSGISTDYFKVQDK